MLKRLRPLVRAHPIAVSLGLAVVVWSHIHHSAYLFIVLVALCAVVAALRAV